MPEPLTAFLSRCCRLVACTLLVVMQYGQTAVYARQADSSMQASSAIITQEQRSETADSLLTTGIQPGKIKALVYGSAGAYAGMLVGLNALWYAEHDQSSFHFFNDNRQWMAIDKAGHAYSAFHLSRASAEALRWVGVPAKKASLYGSLGGWLFMLPIEILDGFSSNYGASPGDLIANSAGSILYGGQMLLWQEVRIKPKFSFMPSPFAKERPKVLGHNLPTQLLKDYNGQTHWLSVDLERFMPPESRFPSWLNLAVGYGSSGMVYAYPDASRAAGFHPFNRFFLAPDLDLSRLRSRKKVVNWLLFVLDGIRLPLPALELSQGRLQFHPLYF